MIQERQIQYGKKRNNISKTIKAKMLDWLESIKDDEVKKAIQKDVIVTGGCIASMYLGERVNDFDVYFKTKETTLLVAKYYVKLFAELSPDYNDVRIQEKEDGSIRIHIQSSGVAGEAPEKEESEGEEGEEVIADSFELEEDKAKYQPIFLSQNAITLSNKVQIIVRFHGSPEEIHKNFDFIHAQCYWEWQTGGLVASIEALEAMLSRTLVYRGSLYPICSLFRAKKFINRGWNIGAGEILKMAFQISELDLTDIAVLNEQLIGVDSYFMNRLIEALASQSKEHPEKLNSTYVVELIDRIFG